MIHYISKERLSLEKLKEIFDSHSKIALCEESKMAVIKCRRYLDEKMKDPQNPIYGITTGFGSLYNVTIPSDELSQLQYNLVVSHACGAGKTVRPEIVKLMLFLKVQSLSYGHSGVQLATVQRLIDMFNEDIIPVVYQQGSLGASGDLAPLAHLSLPLIGLGEVLYKGQIRPLLANTSVFHVDYTKTPLADRIEAYFVKLLAGPGSARRLLQEELK